MTASPVTAVATQTVVRGVHNGSEACAVADNSYSGARAQLPSTSSVTLNHLADESVSSTQLTHVQELTVRHYRKGERGTTIVLIA